MAPAHSVWGVDGVSLVESSTNRLPWSASVSQYYLSWNVFLVQLLREWGVEPGVGAGSGDCLGTLLGPEESGARPGRGGSVGWVSCCLIVG
jgi:hypothetical protein